MIELTNVMALLWMIGSSILMTGISFATVKVTLKVSQRNFEKRLDELAKGWKLMEHRVTEDEKKYRTTTDCEREQNDCEKHRTYHENQLIQKMDGLKEFMIMMDTKRESTEYELSEKLGIISEELAILKHEIARGPIVGN